MPYAHSLPGRPQGEWHRLEDHLRSTAERARAFGAPFGAGDLAYFAGLWHDLGKYAPDWQAFLEAAGQEAPVLGEEQPDSKRRRGPDHSTAGALHAFESLGPRSWVGRILQFVIAGHHAGLANQEELKARLANPEKKRRYQAVRAAAAPEVLSSPSPPSLPAFLAGEARTTSEKDRANSRLESLIRMSFSALVDADFLDTEQFMDRGRSSLEPRAEKRPRFPTISEYRAALDRHLTRFDAIATTPVTEQRRRVLEWCRQAAAAPRGAYSLTVPTGGGKTLSSLAFALRHAEAHRLERIVVALPFLSILDQTVDTYRKALEPELEGSLLIEHHSNVQPAFDTIANRLASENWDARLVVTTQVQLFESLFSNRPSDCRKLHNLADSVLVLDEVQTLPAELLAPILDQLQTLRSDYGATLLLTTATQPALHTRAFPAKLFVGLEPAPTEIVPADATASLFESFRRVEVEWPRNEEKAAWPSLAEELDANEQVLAIVHRRADARDLWRACNDRRPEGWLHLSALMCPAHRRGVLADIRTRLAEGRPCRVVSTQLVEAGVDVDFPVVFRAMAGLESLAQSAGRCNREGNLPRKGRFVVFNAPTEPPGLLRQHLAVARTMLAAEPALDLFQPSTFRRYFDRLYGQRSLDARAIQPLRRERRFEDVAKEFRMIDDAGETVFVPFEDGGRKAIEDVRRFGPSRDRLRRLQPYGVTLHSQALRSLPPGAVELLHDTVRVLVSDIHYDKHLGLSPDSDPTGAHFI